MNQLMMLGPGKRLPPKKFSQRDLMIAMYENGLRTNYLLIAVLGAIVGRPFVGSPPHIVASFLLALASVLFAFIVMFHTKGRMYVDVRLKVAIAAVGVAQVLAIAAEYLPFNPTDGIAILRFIFAAALFYWSFSVPLVDRCKYKDEAGW